MEGYMHVVDALCTAFVSGYTFVTRDHSLPRSYFAGMRHFKRKLACISTQQRSWNGPNPNTRLASFSF